MDFRAAGPRIPDPPGFTARQGEAMSSSALFVSDTFRSINRSIDRPVSGRYPVDHAVYKNLIINLAKLVQWNDLLCDNDGGRIRSAGCWNDDSCGSQDTHPLKRAGRLRPLWLVRHHPRTGGAQV